MACFRIGKNSQRTENSRLCINKIVDCVGKRPLKSPTKDNAHEKKGRKKAIQGLRSFALPWTLAQEKRKWKCGASIPWNPNRKAHASLKYICTYTNAYIAMYVSNPTLLRRRRRVSGIYIVNTQMPAPTSLKIILHASLNRDKYSRGHKYNASVIWKWYKTIFYVKLT